MILRPELWPLILVAPTLYLLLRRLDRRRARLLERIVGPRAPRLCGEKPRAARRLRHALFAGAIALALAAFLEPAWGESSRPGTRPSAEVVVCLDVSRSMLARDISPSRLRRAQEMIRAWLAQAEGDRVALVLFAGSARLAVPLTADRASLARMLDLATPLSVAQGGSDLGGAIALALEAVEGGAGDAAAILLLTDGEDHGGEGLAAARRAQERGIAVHCIAFGTERGAKIPVESAGESESREVFLRDGKGTEVITTMRPETLRSIAAAGAGQFSEAQAGMPPFASLRTATLRRGEERRSRENRYQWPLVAGFVLFAVERLLRRSR